MADDLGPKMVAEFLGTFFLLFVGAGSIVMNAHMGAAGYGLLGIAFAHGIALALGVSATMNISGGHINPAVSIAALATGKIDGRTCGGYIFAQLVASVVAILLLLATMPQDALNAAALGATQIDFGSISVIGAIVLEAILTFILVTTIWGTAISRHAPKIGGFGIGLAVFIDILVGGPLTGASMNPARSFGPNILAPATGIQLPDFGLSLAIYWIGPIIGGLIAGFVYEYGIEEVYG